MLRLAFIVLNILLAFQAIKGEEDLGKLPFCLESYVPGLVLVSTIDGKFSAIDAEGSLKWQIETDPGPLLTSNIHNLELTNSGKWIRIIPSLTGTLYRFDGSTIDPIPISAESLLRSSFKYSDDLVIAGGLEVQTYGLDFRSGKIFYTCSSLKCSNKTENDGSVDNILLIERVTQTVRAIEAHSGHERWNFSVGHHNIKLSHVSCSDPNTNLFDWNITAIVPEGLLIASKKENNIEISWQYHFTSPIARMWKWNGFKLTEIDLFTTRNDLNEFQNQISPVLYIGMHQKQLYIHESNIMQLKLKGNKNVAVKESSSLTKIPWKPVSASGISTEDDSTAISILYSSEYVNGHGYYLYSDVDLEQKSSGICENNKTIRIPLLQSGEQINLNTILKWWKELFVIILTTGLLFNVMRKAFIHKDQDKRNIIFVERHIEVPLSSSTTNNSSSDKLSESNNDQTFESRFTNDFETLRCLGRGGFGIVFEVKQKIDECHYAIKRIKLPDKKVKRESVMREVKALAKLEHNNIVRYFNSWVEKPPYGWQKLQDSIWINETNEFSSDFTSNNKTDVNIDMTNATDSYDKSKIKIDDDSFIVFDNERSDQSKSQCSQLSDNSSMKTDISENETSITENKLCEENPPVYLYIQMQLCKKHSLKEWLVENKIRSHSTILNIFKQIISAVEYVHLQGLIHRDLKPSNIFFSLDGQIKVGDFGLVKDRQECFDLNTNSVIPMFHHTKEVGTHLYMSPEQLDGKKYNYKVDIFSLGIIFFELLIYFCTDMERIRTLTDLRENNYPNDFINKHPQEHELLTMMLCQLPEHRLTTFGIRARPPINCHDNYNEAYDFDLPKAL